MIGQPPGLDGLHQNDCVGEDTINCFRYPLNDGCVEPFYAPVAFPDAAANPGDGNCVNLSASQTLFSRLKAYWQRK